MRYATEYLHGGFMWVTMGAFRTQLMARRAVRKLRAANRPMYMRVRVFDMQTAETVEI